MNYLVAQLLASRFCVPIVCKSSNETDIDADQPFVFAAIDHLAGPAGFLRFLFIAYFFVHYPITSNSPSIVHYYPFQLILFVSTDGRPVDGAVSSLVLRVHLRTLFQQGFHDF